jgi:acetate kinase
MNGDVLVINAGSSSIKVSLFGSTEDGPALQVAIQVEGIGTPTPHGSGRGPDREVLFDQKWLAGAGPTDHRQALAFVVRGLTETHPDWEPAAVGHRVVHGGTLYRQPVVLDATVRANLEKLVPLVPLHQPANLEGIDAATEAFPRVPQVACFDTAFHQGHPWVADTFGLPRQLYDEGVRRYGFHGISYEYVARQMRELAPDVARGRLVVAHLGNGASLCAIRDGRSIDSTMSFTPLDGLLMGTRCGQIDPSVVLYLLRAKGMTADAVSALLNKQSGLLGLSGISSDMRDLLASDKPAAREAVDYFVYRATREVGALAAALGGLDGLVFTAGIGEHAAPVRARVCQGLAWLGLQLDDAANAGGGPRISAAASKVSAWVVPTDEERMIALHVAETLGEQQE